MDMDFYSNLGSYDSAFNDNLVTSFGGNPANFSINPNNSGSTTSCGLLALNHLARYHSAPTSVLQGLLLDDDDDDDDPCLLHLPEDRSQNHHLSLQWPQL